MLFPSEVKVQPRAIPDYETDIASMNRIDRFDLIIEFYSEKCMCDEIW